MPGTPKSTKSLFQELFEAVGRLSSAISSGITGTPINPGPVVDVRHGKATTTPHGHPRR